MKQKGLPVRQRGLAPILIVILIAVALGGYLLYTKQTKTITPALQQTNITTPVPTLKPTTFTKRYYKTTDKIFGSVEYPEEMKNLTDKQLVGLNCSKEFGSAFEKISPIIISINPVLRKIMNAAKSLDYYQTIQSVQYCELEDKRVLVALYNFPSKRGYQTANFGLLENGQLNMKTTSPLRGEGGIAMTGFTPLAYTTDDKFYHLEGGGDNVSELHILRMDLRTNTDESILNCLDGYIDINLQSVEPSCR